MTTNKYTNITNIINIRGVSSSSNMTFSVGKNLFTVDSLMPFLFCESFGAIVHCTDLTVDFVCVGTGRRTEVGRADQAEEAGHVLGLNRRKVLAFQTRVSGPLTRTHQSQPTPPQCLAKRMAGCSHLAGWVAGVSRRVGEETRRNHPIS